MKKSLFLFLVLASMSAFSQIAEKKAMKIPRFATKQDRLLLNLNWDNWLNATTGVDVDAFRSRGFSFLFMNEKVFGEGNTAIAFGLGFSSQNVHSNCLPTYNSDKSRTFLTPITTDYDLNKLSVNYVDLALEFRFRTDENEAHKRFKISAGIKGGILVQSHTKYEDDVIGKIKTYSIENLNLFQYGITGRIGYGHWGVSGYYSLTNLFEDGKGPDVVPVSIGLAYAF